MAGVIEDDDFTDPSLSSDATILDRQKLTETKIAWAKAGRSPHLGQPRVDSERLPPGQRQSRHWPILDLGKHPQLSLRNWKLQIKGLVENPTTLDWRQFLNLPQSQSTSDIHCVTGWSVFENHWQGVFCTDLLEKLQPKAAVTQVFCTSADGYTTNLPLADFAAAGSMLVSHHNGSPLNIPHGGPLRLMVPHLYFWKSAKWLIGLEFRATEKLGYWETRGYHPYGDPWREQRYSQD